MRKFILPVFAVATVAILAGAAVAEGPGGPAAPAPIHGPATVKPAAPHHTDRPMLRGPYDGPTSVQRQVFGDLGGADPIETWPERPGAAAYESRGGGAPPPTMFHGVGR